jgi:hypothetical protein
LSAVEHNVHYGLVVIDAVKLRKNFETTKGKLPSGTFFYAITTLFVRFTTRPPLLAAKLTDFQPKITNFQPPSTQETAEK